jgi:hypothetical protein
MSTTTPLTDDELLARFCDTTLPSDAFHHAEHMRAAWLFVRRYGMPDALREFPAALRRFADAKGATTLYHATITWAYLLLIQERQERRPADNWPTFAAANADLMSWKPSVLDTLYAPGTLATELARRTFVMPDRALSQRSGDGS